MVTSNPVYSVKIQLLKLIMNSGAKLPVAFKKERMKTYLLELQSRTQVVPSRHLVPILEVGLETGFSHLGKALQAYREGRGMSVVHEHPRQSNREQCALVPVKH